MADQRTIFGLTGGVGMGQSAAAEIRQSLGAEIIDTDVLARELVAPGQPAWEEIRARFGNEVISPEGQLRRDELARQVFADAQARRDLETILHPRIREEWVRK